MCNINVMCDNINENDIINNNINVILMIMKIII